MTNDFTERGGVVGFYLRKSIRVGPFRFNLSNGGIGVSAGVPGFRIGMGPRGNYVRMGAGGIYYRATFPASTRPRSAIQQTPEPSPHFEPSPIPSGTHDPLAEIESGNVAQMVDSSSTGLLEELNRKQRAVRFGPVALVLLVVAMWYVNAQHWPQWALILVGIVGVAVVVGAYLYDVLHKSVVLFYEFDARMEKAYGELHEAASRLAACSGVWHIEASGKVRNRKYHAGASELVSRKRTIIRPAAPPFVKTNVRTISLKVGRQTLHFFPDRVLVYDGSGVGAVSYGNLTVAVNPSRFIEDGSVPSDAEVVDYTWQFVNKKGGPDRRFKNNRRLAVCLYDEVRFMSATGLNELIQFSKRGAAAHFAGVISNLARVIPGEKASTSMF